MKNRLSRAEYAARAAHFGDKLVGVIYAGPEHDRLFSTLRRRLLKIGGRGVIPGPHVFDLERLVARGVLLRPSGVRLRFGEMKECHRNVERLAQLGERRAYGMALCAALGAWMEHSWLVAPDGFVIETTERRDAYFGIVSRRPVRRPRPAEEIARIVAEGKKERRAFDKRIAKMKRPAAARERGEGGPGGCVR